MLSCLLMASSLTSLMGSFTVLSLRGGTGGDEEPVVLLQPRSLSASLLLSFLTSCLVGERDESFLLL